MEERMFVKEDPVKGGRKWKTLSKGTVPEHAERWRSGRL
jgi:hypothetical protein